MSILSWMLALSLAILVPPVDEPVDEAKVVPAGFASDEAITAFEAGVAEFENADFSTAAASFKTAKKGAKGDAKKTVSLYEKAVKGAKKLGKIEKGIQQEKWRAAYRELAKVTNQYGEGPLSVHLEPLRETIEGELFLWLATFEADPPEAESAVKERRPDKATPNDDEDYVKEGERSLEWNSGSRGALAGMNFGFLPLAGFDGSKVYDYPIFDAWIYSTDENFGKFAFYFGVEEGGPGRTMAFTGDILKTRCFFHHITLEKKGWVHVRVDLLKEIPKHHNLEWSEVTGVSLMTFPPSHPKIVYIDGLRLERP